MEWIKLLAGIALLGIFGWLLIKNGKRSGYGNAILSVDIILGLIAGIYLVFSSIHTLVF